MFFPVFLKINYDTLFMMAKFAGVMLLILAIVFGLALATPWLAKKVDKIRGKSPVPEEPLVEKPDEVGGICNEEKVEKPDEVSGIYDAQSSTKEEEK
ncbi:MAG: hypothetical protein RR540_09035 [Oscillospiraceae bacterium]